MKCLDDKALRRIAEFSLDKGEVHNLIIEWDDYNNPEDAGWVYTLDGTGPIAVRGEIGRDADATDQELRDEIEKFERVDLSNSNVTVEVSGGVREFVTDRKEKPYKVWDKSSRRIARSVSDDPFEAYVETALWSSTDMSDESGGEPLDRNYGMDDIDEASLAEMRQDVEKFFSENAELINRADEEYGMDSGRVAHDFWLTRNRHGAGFWDGDYGDIGDTLTEIAHSFGECYLAVGEDEDGEEKLYLE